MTDMVNHPPHYNNHPIFPYECIDYTRWMSFNQGNAFKYLWRAGLKDDVLQELNKARWYLADILKTQETAKTPIINNLVDDYGVNMYMIPTMVSRLDQAEKSTITLHRPFNVAIGHAMVRVAAGEMIGIHKAKNILDTVCDWSDWSLKDIIESKEMD